MAALNEELLDAWLGLSTAIINSRIVSEMPYKESLICNILYRNQLHNPDRKLTATDLCQETRMLKSQMNRTLNSMEKKKLILRERSMLDKREVFVTLDMTNAAVYEKQHKRILQIVDAIIEQTGAQKAEEIIELFRMISNLAEGIIQ